MQSLTVFTLADDTFKPGLAGLVNSLRAVGFDGPIVVGAPGSSTALPPVPGMRVVTLGDESVWLGLLKPTLLLQEAIGPFVFLDADIIAANRYLFAQFEALTAPGPMLALEGLISPFDHRRHRWAKRLGAPPPARDAWAYYNSGFLAGYMPRDRALLDAWAEAQGKVLLRSARHFQDEDFPLPDQDALNAVIQTWADPVVSLQFPDWWSAVAPHNPFLHFGGLPRPAFYHAIGEKPWQLRDVPPRNPTPYESSWFRHAVMEPVALRVPIHLPDAVRRWLAGHWSGRLRSRSARLGQRLVGR